tara:strand:- start:72 stop:275 length:204 start_codon:yes stop_codon:yes gene_type:complete
MDLSTKPCVYVSANTRSKTIMKKTKLLKEKTLNKLVEKAELKVKVKPMTFKQCDIFCDVAGNKPSNR